MYKYSSRRRRCLLNFGFSLASSNAAKTCNIQNIKTSVASVWRATCNRPKVSTRTDCEIPSKKNASMRVDRSRCTANAM